MENEVLIRKTGVKNVILYLCVKGLSHEMDLAFDLMTCIVSFRPK